MKRIALVLDGGTPVNAVVIAEGAKGDEWLEANPEAVEVTGLDPMPGVGTGWTYSGGVWVAPPVPEITPEELAKLDNIASAIGKLEALGLTVDEVRDVFGIEV